MKRLGKLINFYGSLKSALVFMTFATAGIILSAAVAFAVPSITAVNPPDSATVVPVNQPVTATFSEAMDPLSINTGSFTLFQFAEIKSIAAGFSHTVALKADGTVIAWGDNSVNQTAVPTGLSGVIAIAAGEAHTLALKSNGTVVAWGRNESGQITIPSGLSGVTAIAAGFGHSVALKSDGTVVAWGLNKSGQTTIPNGLTGVTAIAAGGYHTLALKTNGKVVTWGQNLKGQAGTNGLSGVTAIAAGWFHSLALLDDGTVTGWGENAQGQIAVPGDLAGVTAIAAGGYHTLVLKNDGRVIAWGDNSYNQLAVPINLSGGVSVSAGAYLSMALKNDGTVAVWGCNTSNQIVVPISVNRTAVPATVAYDSGSNTASLTPLAALPYSRKMFAAVSGTVRSESGVNTVGDFSWRFTTDVLKYLLSISLAGDGSGSVLGDQGKIACETSSSKDCSDSYYSGTPVRLLECSNSKSQFSSWSGDCSGNGDCALLMDKDRTVTATFRLIRSVKLTNRGVYVGAFATLQDAYNLAGDRGDIQALSQTFNEDLLFNDTKTVSLNGGYDSNDNMTGTTTIGGSLTIGNGTTIISNIVIQ